MLTKTQKAALKWLEDHGGEGVQQKKGVLAQGEFAPFNPGTWKALVSAGAAEFYTPLPYRRIRVKQ